MNIIFSKNNGSARGVMVIVVGNEHADTSSNPDISHSTSTFRKLFSLQLWVNSRAD